MCSVAIQVKIHNIARKQKKKGQVLPRGIQWQTREGRVTHFFLVFSFVLFCFFSRVSLQNALSGQGDLS